MPAKVFRSISVLALLAATVLAGAGCGEQPRQRPPMGVSYLEVKSEALVLTTALPGRVSAYMSSEVRPQVTGIIQERLFTEGADVKAGDTLYQIDPALFRAACNSAAANLARAEANLVASRLLAERYGKIIKSNAVSRQDHDDAVSAYAQAQATVESARQAVETARINLGYTSVAAPVGGRIGRSFVTRGALVTQNQPQPLAVIQHMDAVYVDVVQSNTELLRLRRALAGGAMQPLGAERYEARLLLEDGSPYVRKKSAAAAGAENHGATGVPTGEAGGGAGGETDWIVGELLFSDVTVGRGTGLINVRAKFDNPDGMLLPGMHVRALLDEARLDNAVLVPQRTVLRDKEGRSFVYVLQEREGEEGLYTVARADVEVQRNVGNRWLISSGLKPGDLLLFEGHLKTAPGRVVSGKPVSGPETSGHEASKNIYNAEHSRSPRVR